VGLTKLEQSKRKRIKKIKKKITKLEPNYPTNTWTQGTGGTLDFTGATNNFVLTSDGYDYVDIRTLIYKLNEIIDYIMGEK